MLLSHRIFLHVGFAILSTMVVMLAISLLPDMYMPPRFYLVGVVCSGGLSWPIITKILTQSEENRRLRQEAVAQMEDMRRIMEIDALTRLLTRQTFLERAASLRQFSGQVWLMLVDVDHFKRFNDEHGHQTGDAVLAAIGTALREAVREQDLCGRLGGEEFALCLHEASDEDARRIADHVAASIRALRIRDPAGRINRATVSIGVTALDGAETMEAGLHRADIAMYAAKRAGRDRVHYAA